jgi:hypothetical protein
MKLSVEAVETIVRADGQVQFNHYRFGEILEELVSSDTVSFENTLGGSSRAESSAVAGGSAESDSLQEEQYFSREPLTRSPIRPQRSQYFGSKTSNSTVSISPWTGAMVCAALFLTFLSGLMRAC